MTISNQLQELFPTTGVFKPEIILNQILARIEDKKIQQLVRNIIPIGRCESVKTLKTRIQVNPDRETIIKTLSRAIETITPASSSSSSISSITSPLFSSSIDTLICERAPIIIFHKNEEYFPASLDKAFRYSELYKDDSQIIPKNDQERERIVHNNECNRILISQSTIEQHQLFDQENEVYAIVKENKEFYEITYVYYFLFNGPTSICCGGGAHQSDIEHVSILVDKKDSLVKSIYLSQHNGGEQVKAQNVERDGRHPIVFCSLNSHAFYKDPGCKCNYLVASDRRSEMEGENRGIKWKQYQIVNLNKKDPYWLKYAGNLGGKCYGLVTREWVTAFENTY